MFTGIPRFWRRAPTGVDGSGKPVENEVPPESTDVKNEPKVETSELPDEVKKELEAVYSKRASKK